MNNKSIKGFRARLASVEATVYLDRTLDISESPVFKMTREQIEISYKEEVLHVKNIQLDIMATGGGENLTHKEIWNKLQGYAPKATFKLPVISIIESE
jgi:hypothetical protein